MRVGAGVTIGLVVAVVAAAVAAAFVVDRGGGPNETSSPAAQASTSPSSPADDVSPDSGSSPGGSTPTSSATPTSGTTPAPGATAASLEKARAVAVPILMYHHIAPPHGDGAYLYVSPATFAAQIRRLHDEGYQAVTLKQVFDHWEYNEPLPAKPVVLTFDDGYVDVYTAAAPVLAQYDWPGVINVTTWSIDAPYGMSRRQMRDLVARGWEVGCHSTSHRDMTTLSAADLHDEIVVARGRIDFKLKTQIESFCYPGGAYNATVIAAIRAAGYRSATSVDAGLGRWSERWRLRRITPTESGFTIPKS